MLRKLLILVAILGALSHCHFGFADEPIQLRILSYNIHHAEGVDGKLDLERIANVINSARPDVVALQEVDRECSRTGKVNQPKELARLTQMHVAFGANIELQGGQYGNAILSRLPIVEHENQLLPNIDEGEQRGVLMARIELPNEQGNLLFLATHLDHRRDDRERLASSQAINELVQQYNDRPVLLAGDMNDIPESGTIRELEAQWQRTNREPLATIPVDKPTRQIDYVFCRPDRRWKIVNVEVLDEAVASDHRAILATIELQPMKPQQ